VRTRVVSVLSALAVAWLASPCASTAAQEPGPASPIVLELFTSQGCSSCPPADRLLSQLGLDERTKGRILPLAFHVDYWNRIGWTDPFSAQEWSARQEAYVRAFGLDGGYTPQLVVNGRVQLNGSDQARALSAIAADLERPSGARVTLTARKGPDVRPEVSVDVAAEVGETAPRAKLQLLVVLFENGLVTAVERGENGGRTLRNDFIVRRLEKAFSLEARAGARAQRTLNLPLRPEWNLANVGVAALLQDQRSMSIHAAAVHYIR
jgi:hypothetical protein